MIFTDLLFITVFLPVSLIAMLALGENWEKNIACVGLSLVMLAWARPVYILLVLLPVILTYFAARMKNSPAVDISAGIISFGILLGLAVAVGMDNTLKGGVTAAALLLMAYKLYDYLTDVRKGEEAEKSFISLCVYFLSFEFIYFNPNMKYSAVREGINNRSVKLSAMATGMSTFIIGLSEAAILGLGLDRLRLAALYTDTVPWGDALWGCVFTALELYVILDGFMRISSGLAALNGIKTVATSDGFIPRLDVSRHIHGVYPALAERIRSDFSGEKAVIGLVAASVTAGVCLTFNVGAGAFAGLLVAAMILASVKGSGAFEKIFGLLLTACGFTLMAVGDVTKLGNIFSYGFDMSVELFEEIKRVVPWATISLFCITPMPRVLAAIWREKMAESVSAYTAMRIISALCKAILLCVSLLAVVGYR